jgi:hypothetical protein
LIGARDFTGGGADFFESFCLAPPRRGEGEGEMAWCCPVGAAECGFWWAHMLSPLVVDCHRQVGQRIGEGATNAQTNNTLSR